MLQAPYIIAATAVAAPTVFTISVGRNAKHQWRDNERGGVGGSADEGGGMEIIGIAWGGLGETVRSEKQRNAMEWAE